MVTDDCETSCSQDQSASNNNLSDDVDGNIKNKIDNTNTNRLNSNNTNTVLVGCVAQLVERWSLTGELSLFCARPAADG